MSISSKVGVVCCLVGTLPVVFGGLSADQLLNGALGAAREDDLEGVLGPQCQQEMEMFLDAKEEPLGPQFWALKMSDSYGSWPRDGMQEGHRYSLGAYYSCLEVGGHGENYDDGDRWEPTEPAPFSTQYCQISTYVLPKGGGEEEEEEEDSKESRGIVKPLLPPGSPLLGIYPFQSRALQASHYGVCLPASCSVADIQAIFGAMSASNEGAATRFVPLPTNCYSRDNDAANAPEWTAGDSGYVSLLAIFAVAVAAGTCVDLWHRRRMSQASGEDEARALRQRQAEGWRGYLVGFSFYTNTIRLLDTSPGKPGQVNCLNGIRFWSMVWVVLGHTYSYSQTAPPLLNEDEVLHEMGDGFLFRVIRNPWVAVDSFLLLSGCLLAYLTFKELDRCKGRLNVPLFYLHRYIRLTGVYAFFLGFFTTLFKYFNWGPQSRVRISVWVCQENWWRNLLYINNFHIAEGICMGQTWYMSLDFQMFLCSPFVLLPMYWIEKKWGKRWSLAFLGAFLAAMTAVILGLAISKDWAATMDLAEDIQSYVEENYYMPWVRCQPYIVGVGLGYILHHTRNRRVRINRYLVCALWACAFATGVAVVYGVDVQGILNGEKDDLSDAASAAYNAFHRLAWGVALSWLIFACHHGYGGFVDAFLSWEAFIPLGRIAFNVYLFHYNIAQLMWMTVTYDLVGTQLTVVVVLLALFAFCCVVAFLASVCFEIPMVTVEKVIFRGIEAVSKTLSSRGKSKAAS